MRQHGAAATQVGLKSALPTLGRAPWHLERGDVQAVYASWPSPSAIISDGAYGLGGFPGDPRGVETLPSWYQAHIKAWSARANPATTLWFWNSEVGWAVVHPLLVQSGWEYVQTIVWDKGVAHIAGNVNGETIRQFPVTTEICVFYRRRLTFASGDAQVPAKVWLRAEWLRSGLPLSAANRACGVSNAATRKYLTQDWLWYFPPPEAVAQLAAFSNRYGRPEGRPYFSLDGRRPVTASDWQRLRHPWTHQHGMTNVWAHPPVGGGERLRGTGQRSAPRVYNPGPNATAHLNQKPLAFMEAILRSSTAPGDVIWEPFGGLCTASVAALRLGRTPYCAEIHPPFAELAASRLAKESSRENERSRTRGRD